MLLYFEHHTKCTYVKNMLDLNKSSLRKRIVTQAKSFLDSTANSRLLHIKHKMKISISRSIKGGGYQLKSVSL